MKNRGETFMLQRGRARVSAEIKMTVGVMLDRSTLQRGRARVSAEIALLLLLLAQGRNP